MALNLEDIAGHPALHRAVRAQSLALLQIYEATPRLASVFATQQRWLMAHVGLALHFRRDPHDHRTELTVTRFMEAIRRNSVASRNTADAFIKEMLHYHIIEYLPKTEDGRAHPFQVTAGTLKAFAGWVVTHLRTLDSLDGGSRLAMFLERPDMIAKLQPLVADGLLSSSPVREPKQTFSLFIWLNNGGIVMDRLMSGIDPDHAGLDRIPTSVVSTAEFADWAQTVANPSGAQIARCRGARQYWLAGPARPFGHVGVEPVLPGVHDGPGGQARHCRDCLPGLLSTLEGRLKVVFRNRRIASSGSLKTAGRRRG